jgi:hypothetical protein
MCRTGPRRSCSCTASSKRQSKLVGGDDDSPLALGNDVGISSGDNLEEGFHAELQHGYVEPEKLRQGHNLKLTYEWFEPNDDVDEDEQTRASLLYEWSPIQFIQLRAGVRVYDGIPQNDNQNRKQAFLQLHGFF